MPHTMMNGMTSHAFAAIMTATVVIFPTPSDLWHTILPPKAQTEEARLQTGGVLREPLTISSSSTEAEVLDALNRCVHIYSVDRSPLRAECSRIVDTATEILQTRPSERLDEELRLTITAKCRNLWTEGRNHQTIQECQDRLPVLAERG